MDSVSDGRINNGMSIWAVWFSFSGRINRKTFWLKGVLPPLGAIYGLLLATGPVTTVFEIAGDPLTYFLLGEFLFCLACVVVLIAVAAKRLHDCNKPGWWVLTIFIPVVGLIIAIFGYIALGIIKGDTEPNRYGDVP